MDRQASVMVQVEAAVGMTAREIRARGGVMPAPSRHATWLARRVLRLNCNMGLAEGRVPMNEALELAGFDPVSLRVVDYDRFYDWMERHGTRRRRKKRRVT